MDVQAMVTLLLAIVCVVACAFHVVSTVAVAFRSRQGKLTAFTGKVPPITIVRPISGADPFLAETLGTTFTVEGEAVQIVFCAARASDPAVETARALIAAHPGRDASLLIGDDRISRNPKLNNCVKGWAAVRNDLVVMVDSNVLLPGDYLRRLVAAWDCRTGLVTAPPAGCRPESFSANVECAFLNTHQARWQLFADQLGIGFAQGKNLVMRKSIMEPLGGMAALAREPAEDAAATKIIRDAGLKVRLTDTPYPQPLGPRTFAEMWSRQVRWARLRRATFPLLFLPEILCGSAVPIVAGMAAAWLQGYDGWAAGAVILSAWIACELLLAKIIGWHLSWSQPAAMIVRDLLLPIVWIWSYASNGIEWQGHEITAKREASEAPAAL
jgi:ceramide glucosyltransferase